MTCTILKSFLIHPSNNFCSTIYSRACSKSSLFPYREAEGELSLCAGDYLLVWTSGEPQGGYLDAELLDGRRGLVPASFVQRLVGKWTIFASIL